MEGRRWRDPGKVGKVRAGRTELLGNVMMKELDKGEGSQWRLEVEGLTLLTCVSSEY